MTEHNLDVFHLCWNCGEYFRCENPHDECEHIDCSKEAE